MTSWTASVVGTALRPNTPPLFKSDATGLLVASGGRTLLYGIPSGQLIQADTHNTRVVSICLDPFNPQQMYTCCEDGSVTLRDINSGEGGHTWQLGMKVESLVVDRRRKHSVFVLLRRNTGSTILSGDLDPATEGLQNQSVLWQTECAPTQFFLSPSGHFLCALYKQKYCHVFNLASQRLKRLSHKQTIRCAAFHPNDALFAFGDEAGKLCLDYNILSPSCPDIYTSSPTQYHWHSVPVLTIAFSADGALIYTGGLEEVLVIWRHESGEKQFLPRIGSALACITVANDSRYIAIHCEDCSIRVIAAASLQHSCTVQSLKGSRVWAKALARTGLVVEGSHGWLVLNSRGGYLQFYDTRRDINIGELMVAPSPQVSVHQGRAIPPTIITRILFSSTAAHLVTVHKSRGHVMKFWRYDPRHNTYRASTEVDLGQSKLTGMAYNPARDLVATCSADSHFKLWALEDNKNWSCLSVGCYRNDPATAVAFSYDGSLLAVLYRTEITIWEVDTNTLVHIFTTSSPLIGVHFIPHTSFLLSYSDKGIFVHNLVTASLWWSSQMPVAHVAVDSYTPGDHARFVVAYGPQVALFTLESPAPVAVWTLSSRVAGIAFQGPLISKQQDSEGEGAIVIINKNLDIVRLTEHVTESQMSGHRGPSITHYERIYGKVSMDQSLNQIIDAPHQAFHVVASDLLQGPSHILPAPASLYDTYMSHMLCPVTQEPPVSHAQHLEQQETGKDASHQPKHQEFTQEFSGLLTPTSTPLTNYFCKLVQEDT